MPRLPLSGLTTSSTTIIIIVLKGKFNCLRFYCPHLPALQPARRRHLHLPTNWNPVRNGATLFPIIRITPALAKPTARWCNILLQEWNPSDIGTWWTSLFWCCSNGNFNFIAGSLLQTQHELCTWTKCLSVLWSCTYRFGLKPRVTPICP